MNFTPTQVHAALDKIEQELGVQATPNVESLLDDLIDSAPEFDVPGSRPRLRPIVQAWLDAKARLCSYCRQPKNSAGCQRSHP